MLSIIKLLDINKAITDNITLALKDTEFRIDIEFIPNGKNKPNGVVFSSTNITKNIVRPSFYIDFEDVKSNKFNYSTKERNLSVKLFYFAKDRDNSKVELLKIQDLLESIFLEEIKITDSFYFPSSEVEFDLNKEDGYLTASLELYSLEEIPVIDNAEYADTLEYNQKNN